MESTLGISRPAFEWIRSYLSARTLRVNIDDSFSAQQEILWSVSQESGLGPYSSRLPTTLRNTDKKAWSKYPCFIKPINQHAVNIGLANLENCPTDITLIEQGLNEPVGNLGAVFDPNMNMSAQVSILRA